MRTSSISAGSVADDAASTSTPRPAPSSNTDATIANNSNANLTSYQKRNSLLAVPTRTSSRNQPSPDTPGNALPDGGSNSRKRRKKKDGDSSSVNTGHSTTEGRAHKPHQGGGISKFFSVFLNCCRAPDNTSGDAPRKAKPQSPRVSQRAAADVPGPRITNSLKDSGIGTESKDVVMEGEKADGAHTADGDIQMITPSVAVEPEISEKKEFVAENAITEKPTLSEETTTSVPKAPQTTHIDTPMAVVENMETIRPYTSSPVPQHIPAPTKEDVTMPDSTLEEKEKVPVIKPELPSVPTPVEEEGPTEVRTAVEEHTAEADDQQQITIVEPQPTEQKQWLLPPLKPEMQGKKCLVLDLDETLVHSSFKVVLT